MSSVKESAFSFDGSAESTDLLAQKRLGQYFTDFRVARLLAHFGRIGSCKNAIDPMAGSANMLAACHEVGQGLVELAGIELDQRVSALASERLTGKGRVVNGNAFDADVWSTLAPMWDLVITNPPYVRYQSLSTAANVDSDSLDMDSVRRQLSSQVQSIVGLGENEKSLLLRAISGYSGLADLSTPSWLLCASRVSIGGRMAIVFPTVWLSRKYMAPVLAVLCRLFDLEYIIEDSSGVWFPNADVRTALLIARRVPDKGWSVPRLPHKHVLIDSDASTKDSVVGAAFPHSKKPESDFVYWLDSADDGAELGSGTVQVTCSEGSDILRTARCAAWVLADSPELGVSPNREDLVPELMTRIVGRGRNQFLALGQLGWEVGQGLRTGANEFFYVHRVEGGRWISKLAPEQALNLPDGALLPALTRQSELDADQCVVEGRSNTGLLYLEKYARERDARRIGGRSKWIPASSDLDWLISIAEEKCYERNGHEIYLPELSAVKTNKKLADKDAHLKRTRFWYHLPPLRQRHRPDLLIPRVNHKGTRALLNKDRNWVIDANFSALWRRDESLLDQMALYAVLCSTWTACYFELRATVLGGGALKVEATHIKGLPIPVLDEDEIAELSNMGTRIAAPAGHTPKTERIRHRIDEVLVGALRCNSTEAVIVSLTELLDRSINKRTRKC